MSKTFRNAVLTLAARYPFARPLVNSGRLSLPCAYEGFPGFAKDALDGPARTRPGMPAPDAPVGGGFLLDSIGGVFTLLGLNCDVPDSMMIAGLPVTGITLANLSDELKSRYLGSAEAAVYLIRPDQHIVARWNDFAPQTVERAVSQAIGKAPQ